MTEVRGRKSKVKKKEYGSIAARVREAVAELKEFPVYDLVNYDFGCYIGRQRVRGILSDFLKAGEVVRQDDGWYRHVPKKKLRTKLDVIWHLVRSHRQFDTNEIERLSGSARCTVLEYLRCLSKSGYLRQVKLGQWQLINDPGPETPVNAAKCARLKKIRQNGQGQGMAGPGKARGWGS